MLTVELIVKVLVWENAKEVVLHLALTIAKTTVESNAKVHALVRAWVVNPVRMVAKVHVIPTVILDATQHAKTIVERHVVVVVQMLAVAVLNHAPVVEANALVNAMVHALKTALIAVVTHVSRVVQNHALVYALISVVICVFRAVHHRVWTVVK